MFKDGSSLKDESKKASKKEKSKASSSSSSAASSKHSSAAGASASSSSSSSSSSASATAPSLSSLPGPGSITISGTVVSGVSGSGTTFSRFLLSGDALVVKHPLTGKEEMRVVRAVVSDSSLMISSAFSFSSAGSCCYEYISKQRKTLTDEESRAEAHDALCLEGDKASGATSGGVLQHRVKSAGGGYRIVSETVGTDLSREEMLEKRKAKKSDRYC